MNIQQSFILGIVQGVTEFFPVSSSAHLVFLQHYFGFKEAPILFDCLLHFSTLLATIVFFWKKIEKIIFFTAEGKNLIKLIFLASLPTAFIGLLFRKIFEQTFNSVTYPAFFLLVTGSLLWVANKKVNLRKEKNSPRIIVGSVLIVGMVQGFALLPGISRSGSTIATGVILGWSPTFSAEFSFLLSLPAIAGVTLIKLLKVEFSSLVKELVIYLPGMFFSFIFGLLSLRLLWQSLLKYRWKTFSYYCWFLGLAVLILQFL